MGCAEPVVCPAIATNPVDGLTLTLDIPVREYLGAVLPGLAEVSIQKLAELTPAAWAARNR